MTHLYEVGDLIEADIPGGVTVIGRIVEASFPREYVIESTSGVEDDGHRYDVKESEITTVLDS